MHIITGKSLRTTPVARRATNDLVWLGVMLSLVSAALMITLVWLLVS